jgi:hypothetical protein
MAKHIAKYETAWHPDLHRGVIFLEYADGGKGRLDASDAAEFSALLSILRHPSAVMSSEGWIETDLEEPGGAFSYARSEAKLNGAAP